MDSFGFFWILLDSFGFCWILLESFEIFWNLLESSGIFLNLFESFGFFLNLFESFGILWILSNSLGFFCLCRLSLQLNPLNPLESFLEYLGWPGILAPQSYLIVHWVSWAPRVAIVSRVLLNRKMKVLGSTFENFCAKWIHRI